MLLLMTQALIFSVIAGISSAGIMYMITCHHRANAYASVVLCIMHDDCSRVCSQSQAFDA